MYFYDTSCISVYLHFTVLCNAPFFWIEKCPDLFCSVNYVLTQVCEKGIIICLFSNSFKLLHSVSRCQILFAGLFFCVNRLTTVETQRLRRRPLCLRSLQVKRSEWFKTAIEDAAKRKTTDAAQWGIKWYREGGEGGGETGRIKIKKWRRTNIRACVRPWAWMEVRRGPSSPRSSFWWWFGFLSYHSGTRDERRSREEERGHHMFSP